MEDDMVIITVPDFASMELMIRKGKRHLKKITYHIILKCVRA